eukprot:jgi/Mesen1/7881/ME000420S07027
MASIAASAGALTAIPAASLRQSNVSRDAVSASCSSLNGTKLSLSIQNRQITRSRLHANSIRAEDDIGSGIPTNRYSGYVEKDTAGQTNIYSVEPTIYVADSAFSTSTRGSSSEGSSGTLTIVSFLAVAVVSGAAAVLFTVGKSPVAAPEDSYSGPPLTYYIQKFSGVEAPAEFSAPAISEPESAPAVSEPEPASPITQLESAASAVTEPESAPPTVEPEAEVVSEPTPVAAA